ncbi:MAG: LutB/LldF family L-lactate oxidation iron-sulfur protein [Alphaproteobacteria bacterium]
MQRRPAAFNDNAAEALLDADLQRALGAAEAGFGVKRRKAIEGLPEFDALCDQAASIKDHVLDHLDVYLERFEAQVFASGGMVHWCEDAEQARDIILKLCRSVNAKMVTKGKSMVAEEIDLNPFLETNGIRPVETDLGEYIIQLADEPPSHIIGPALHKTKDQVSDLFHVHHPALGFAGRQTEGEALVGEARAILRQQYLQADVGITGANFLIAETGSTVIVTNEGNGDMTQIFPRMHIVIASIEKIVPTLEDAATLLRVLARSATGQEMSVYTTFSTGSKRRADADGPEQFHVVLLDNGRSDILGGNQRDILRCIRCGACMNNCPVYMAAGGHAYGATYMGPMGSVLTPNLTSLHKAQALPFASSFCGKCEAVCPMRIPLPKLMRDLRNAAHEQRITPVRERLWLALWSWVAQRPELYHRLGGVGLAVLKLLARGRGRFHWLPLAGGWTATRDFPAPQGESFMAQWARRGKPKA